MAVGSVKCLASMKKGGVKDDYFLWLVILILNLKGSRSAWETNLWGRMGGSVWIGILMCETHTKRR